jgi:predicted transcriptional regulator
MKTTLSNSATYSNNNDSELQNDSIEGTLLKHIDENPGLRYRQLLRLTDLVNGVLSYHLSVLERSKQIRVNRNKSREITIRYRSCDGFRY